MTNKNLSDAIDRLADLFDYGHLQASTEPAAFIEMVADSIETARDLQSTTRKSHQSRIELVTNELKTLRSFYELTIKERDYERVRADRIEKERNELHDQLKLARELVEELLRKAEKLEAEKLVARIECVTGK